MTAVLLSHVLLLLLSMAAVLGIFTTASESDGVKFGHSLPLPAPKSNPTATGLQLLAPVIGSTLVAGSKVAVLFSGGDPTWNVLLSLVDVDRWAVVATLASNVPNAAGQFVWTVGSNFNTSSRFQLYLQDMNVQDWTYGPVFYISDLIGFRLTQPGGDAAVLQAGSEVVVQWSGGLTQWTVALSLINVTGWNVQTGVGQTANLAQQFFWKLPTNLLCTDTYQFYIADTQTTTWLYGPTFTLTGCK